MTENDLNKDERDPASNPEALRKIREHIASRFSRIIEIGDMLFGEGEIHFSVNLQQNTTFDPENRITAEVVSLEQAREKMPFEIRLPTWAPEGFRLKPDFRIMLPPPETVPFSMGYSVHGMWSHEDDRSFGFDIWQYPPNVFHGPIPVEKDGVSELAINGRPAALITRRKSFLPHTGETIILDDPNLLWKIDNLEYQLRVARKSLSIDELIRVAESIP